MPNQQEISYMMNVLPLMSQAVKYAENNPKNFGVLSTGGNPGRVLDNSVRNNFNRWLSGEPPAPWIQDSPSKFVDFMGRRWAPPNAENDPYGLNKNWSNNVRYFLKKRLPRKDYMMLERLDFVGNRASKVNTA